MSSLAHTLPCTTVMIRQRAIPLLCKSGGSDGPGNKDLPRQAELIHRFRGEVVMVAKDTPLGLESATESIHAILA